MQAELDIDISTPILILRQTQIELQHAVLGVARSAGRLGIPVYAIRTHRVDPAIRSRYVRGSLDARTVASDSQWLDCLLSFGAQLGTAMLLPIDDRSAVFVEDHHKTLVERFLMPEEPDGLYRMLASKRELRDVCRRLGIPAPVSEFPASEQEAVEAADALGYPVVVKQTERWREWQQMRSPSVLIARTEAELTRAYRRMDSGGHQRVMVQEYIPGGPRTGWIFNGYFALDSTCLAGFTGLKLRQRGADAGPATLGVSVRNEAVAKAATCVMRQLGYSGIVDIDFVYDSRDGRYKLLDVNPRLGGAFRLFVDERGIDVVRAAYLDLTGQPVTADESPDGRRWLVEPFDLLAAARMAIERRLSLPVWSRSLRAIDETAWWSADDPSPFLAMWGPFLTVCGSLASLAVRSRAGRERA